MTGDTYLQNVINAKKAPWLSIQDRRLDNIKSILINWAGSQLVELKESGSSAKGTAIRGASDFDIFISLKSSTSQNLREIYNMLDARINGYRIPTKRQNVSIGITQHNLKIDIVPGKIQSGYQNFHSIYSRKKDTWMQANIDLHISIVRNSGRLSEIILTKIWREIHQLDFPSIYLEMIVIEALKYKAFGDLANNFWAVLLYLRDYFFGTKIQDPSNSNNIISDTISQNEKIAIVNKAREATSKSNWGEIIW